MAAAPLHWQTIRQLSEQIHSGQLSPVELMEHLLDRVAALDDRLHAFRLVPRERAVAGAQAAELALRAGRDSRTAARDSLRRQGHHRRAGSAHHRRIAAVGRRYCRHRRHRGAPPQPGRHGVAGQNPHGAIRPRRAGCQPRSRHAAQPLARHAPRARRLQQRFGRCRGGRPGARRVGHRHRRLGCAFRRPCAAPSASRRPSARSAATACFP